MVITPLFPWDPELCFDYFSLLLAPGTVSESTPHKAGVIEHVVVIQVGWTCVLVGYGKP
ncbi:XRE family transcriptional regulator [Salmonella enterica subsp. enterica serovar Braenderup]|nr:XRE family transcriptional regulator [Salmonella enterica subsp. enterica serovar Braenderup]